MLSHALHSGKLVRVRTKVSTNETSTSRVLSGTVVIPTNACSATNRSMHALWRNGACAFSISRNDIENISISRNDIENAGFEVRSQSVTRKATWLSDSDSADAERGQNMALRTVFLCLFQHPPWPRIAQRNYRIPWKTARECC